MVNTPESPNLSETAYFSNTQFTASLLHENALDKAGFEGWVFCPGMLFDSPDKWWEILGKRDRSHEGLDLYLYKNHQGRILRLDEKTKIPAICDGVVVRIADDFLGRSVIVEHVLSDQHNRLCTIYGHTTPVASIQVGKAVRQGEVIATLAGRSKPETVIPPHLHISLGRVLEAISYDQFEWNKIGSSNTLTLLDPLDIIDWHYYTLQLQECTELLSP